MAGNTKGLALMAAAALALGAGAQKAEASEIQTGVTAPATAYKSPLNLSAEDFKTLEKLGITTTQAEINAEFEELQTYGPVDETTLARQVNRDMAETMGVDYAGNTAEQRAYIEELRQRYGQSEGNSNRVNLILAGSPEEGEQVRIKGIGLRYTRDF